MNPISRAISRYEAVIDRLALATDRHLFGIGDPCLEGVRFYTFEQLSGNLDYSRAHELAADEVDEIEHDLFKAEQPYSLLLPLTEKMRFAAPRFNSFGKVVFVGSWGMGPGEIGWMIRYLNDQTSFERYIEVSGVHVQMIDAYNEAYERDFKEAEQIMDGNRE